MSAEKILIVEDNPLNMRLMEMTLRGRGYTLVKATNGEEALDKAAKEKPALIIMDMQLPTISGIEVTQRLRKMPELSHVPVVAVTAYAMKGDKEKFIEAGCDAYLSKPIDTRELPGFIEDMLKQRR